MSDNYYITDMSGRLPVGLPGGFFIYEAGGNEQILFADENVIRLFGCKTFDEFFRVRGWHI